MTYRGFTSLASFFSFYVAEGCTRRLNFHFFLAGFFAHIPINSSSKVFLDKQKPDQSSPAHAR